MRNSDWGGQKSRGVWSREARWKTALREVRTMLDVMNRTLTWWSWFNILKKKNGEVQNGHSKQIREIFQKTDRKIEIILSNLRWNQGMRY